MLDRVRQETGSTILTKVPYDFVWLKFYQTRYRSVKLCCVDLGEENVDILLGGFVDGLDKENGIVYEIKNRARGPSFC